LRLGLRPTIHTNFRPFSADATVPLKIHNRAFKKYIISSQPVLSFQPGPERGRYLVWKEEVKTAKVFTMTFAYRSTFYFFYGVRCCCCAVLAAKNGRKASSAPELSLIGSTQASQGRTKPSQK
jgi:hypothetical protein